MCETKLFHERGHACLSAFLDDRFKEKIRESIAEKYEYISYRDPDHKNSIRIKVNSIDPKNFRTFHINHIIEFYKKTKIYNLDDLKKKYLDNTTPPKYASEWECEKNQF